MPLLQAYIYLALLYGLLAMKSVLLDDFQSIATASIGPVSITKLTKQEKAVFWGGKLLWLGYFILLPAVQSHHSWSALAALWLLSEAVAGWILAFMFQVSHDIAHPVCALSVCICCREIAYQQCMLVCFISQL